MKTSAYFVASSVVLCVLACASAPGRAQTYPSPPASEPSSTHRFSDVDTDSNGQISREELDRLGDERLVFPEIDIDASSAISRVEWNRFDLRFNEADSDGDGFISSTELNDFDDDTLTFADIDIDKNSSITRAEWNEHNRLIERDAEGESGE
jgi:hypothetical protein